MAWYTYFITATGRPISTGQSDVVPPAGQSKVYVGETRPTGVWNPTTRQYNPRTPRRKVPKRLWLNRFTDLELSNILSVDFITINTDIIALIRYLALIEDVNLDHNIIIVGIDKLVTAGLLNPSRVTVIMANG